VISVLVHLCAVGAFRAALERFAETEEVATVVPHWSPPRFITPPLIPIPEHWRTPAAAPANDGIYDPREESVIFRSIDRVGRMPEPGPVTSDPGTGTTNQVVPPCCDPPPNRDPAFVIVDTPPVPILTPRPAYPQWAKDALIEGKVLVRMLVGTDGIPKKAVVVRGPTGLTEGLESALLRWRFRPALSNGRAVEVWVEIPISFRLGD
jgi:protein TonB